MNLPLRRASIALLVAASASARPHKAPSPTAVTPKALTTHFVALPGSPGRVGMDYLAFDPATRKLWVPAGNTGRVNVLDTVSGALVGVSGFPTREIERGGQKRSLGPSSAAVGDGVVYVGNRADSKVCAIDAASLKVGGCIAIASSPDGLAFVKREKELWITTPRDRSLTVLDANERETLKSKAEVHLEGEPEGYAVDQARGIFYTNIEDQDRTLAIDTATKKILATWKPGCGTAGPRGLALDGAHRFLFVACTDHVVTLDAGHEGAILGSVATGGGVDNIDYAPAQSLLFAAAGKTGTLTVARVDERGGLTAIAGALTKEGARVVVVDDQARAYVADSAGGRLVVVDAVP